MSAPRCQTCGSHDGPTELSMFAPDPTTGVWLRGRADKISEWQGETVLVDLKTTPDSDPKEFNRKAVAGFRYYLQAYVYSDLYQHTVAPDDPAPEMLFVAVSKTTPHLVSVNRLDWQYEDLAQTAMAEAISRYQAGMSTGEWPGYGPDIHLLEPPAWLTHENDEEPEIQI